MSVEVLLAPDTSLTPAIFVARPNQFIVEARIGTRMVLAHMADRGRLEGILYPGARLLLSPKPAANRKTAFQVMAVYVEDELISLDTHLPNRLVAAALTARAFPQFARYPTIQSEVTVGPHRFDFRLSDGSTSCLLEVKSVGLVQDGVAMFPDAPTRRGREQVTTLTRLAYNGQRVAIVFILQRSRGESFAPNDIVDPLFARALRQALATGVEVYAYRCPLTPECICLGENVPVFGSLDTILLTNISIH